MFSSSNSFLGGGNSGRPGPPQYGQQSFSSIPQGQQQPIGFAPQPTGYGGGGLQPQYTGYPPPQQQSFQAPPQQQPQFTGYPPQPQTSFQNPPPLQQSFSTGQLPLQQAQPQKTGLTSSQIAQSFQSVPESQQSASKAAKASAKIPSIRLSFITASDQAKFEQLFKSAVGDGQALEGTITMRPGYKEMLIVDKGRKLRTSFCARNYREALSRRYGKTGYPPTWFQGLIDVGCSPTQQNQASYCSLSLPSQCTFVT